MTPLQQLESRIRELVPSLQELSFGCELKMATPVRYEEFAVGHTKGVVINYSPSHQNYDDWTSSHLEVYLPEWNETYSMVDAEFEEKEAEDYVVVLGHPIQLHHVLQAIGDHREIFIGSSGCFYRNWNDWNKPLARWNLTLPISGQSEETIKFLLEILK